MALTFNYCMVAVVFGVDFEKNSRTAESKKGTIAGQENGVVEQKNYNSLAKVWSMMSEFCTSRKK